MFIVGSSIFLFLTALIFTLGQEGLPKSWTNFLFKSNKSICCETNPKNGDLIIESIKTKEKTNPIYEFKENEENLEQKSSNDSSLSCVIMNKKYVLLYLKSPFIIKNKNKQSIFLVEENKKSINYKVLDNIAYISDQAIILIDKNVFYSEYSKHKDYYLRILKVNDDGIKEFSNIIINNNIKICDKKEKIQIFKLVGCELVLDVEKTKRYDKPKFSISKNILRKKLKCGTESSNKKGNESQKDASDVEPEKDIHVKKEMQINDDSINYNATNKSEKEKSFEEFEKINVLNDISSDYKYINKTKDEDIKQEKEMGKNDVKSTKIIENPTNDENINSDKFNEDETNSDSKTENTIFLLMCKKKSSFVFCKNQKFIVEKQNFEINKKCKLYKIVFIDDSIQIIKYGNVYADKKG